MIEPWVVVVLLILADLILCVVVLVRDRCKSPNRLIRASEQRQP